MSPDMAKRQRRVLVMRLSALGDVAMTVPAVLEAAAACPDTEFTVLTRPFFARLYQGQDMPPNVKVLAWNPRTESLRSMARRLWHIRFTHVADLHNVPRTWLLSALLALGGARTMMVKKHRLGRRRALRTKAQQEPFTMRYRRLLASLLGLPLPSEPSPLPPKEAHAGPRRVGIAPFARFTTKSWPLEHVRTLVASLVDKGIEVSLFGGRGAEQAALEALASQHPGKVANEAGSHSLQEEMALMGRMDAMVAMDSANHHLASLAGTPCLSIWGSTTPACGFMAWRQSQADAVALGLPCQPCSVAGLETCPKGTTECLRALQPSLVEERLMAMLSRDAAPKS